MQVNYWFKISVIHFQDLPVGFIFDTVEGIYIQINEDSQVKNLKFRHLFYSLLFRHFSSQVPFSPLQILSSNTEVL